MEVARDVDKVMLQRYLDDTADLESWLANLEAKNIEAALRRCILGHRDRIVCCLLPEKLKESTEEDEEKDGEDDSDDSSDEDDDDDDEEKVEDSDDSDDSSDDEDEEERREREVKEKNKLEHAGKPLRHLDPPTLSERCGLYLTDLSVLGLSAVAAAAVVVVVGRLRKKP